MTETLPVSRLGAYELVRLLAQGGMADIYLARQAGSNRHVAVKVLNTSRAGDVESCALFMDEARVAGLLCHPNLAGVYEVDVEDGVYYLAMEYVHGADLREVLAQAELRQSAVPFDAAVTIVAGAAAALDHAHRRCGPDGRPLHLVHRDVSLSNIMVGHDGSVKVIDFGIAVSTASMHHTNPGIVRGKASYMSPEQCLGDPVDLRTDVFALGIVLYELTTGRRCFNGNSDFERMVGIVRGEWMLPSQFIQDFPAGLEEVIRTALAPDVEQRYASAAAMIDALEAVAALEGWHLGTAATAGLMQSLFGDVKAPWTIEAEDATFICPPPSPALAWPVVTSPSAPQPTRIITKPRRFARGTESDCYDPDDRPEPEASDWQDEAPTRGRRSVHRMWCARVAA
jgi:serine/threonine-protein kinase